MNIFSRYQRGFLLILTLLLFKILWIIWACWGNGSFDNEIHEIIQRKNFLVSKLVGEPEELLEEMPDGIGLQFQGEWALYSCSMFSEALSNIANIYPETKEDAVLKIDTLIGIVKSPELRMFDKLRWNEDPLVSLDGDNSHLSYLSHLAWMIGNYKNIGGSVKYDNLYDSICETMHRRIVGSAIMNLPTYPNEPIYIPDMLVAMVALNDYAKNNNGKYSETVSGWIERAKREWIDEESGLLVSFIDENGEKQAPIKGSYTALNCYYLTKIDSDFAYEQYQILKAKFSQTFPFSGIKEYYDKTCWLGMDIDAGPIIMNLSPSGTAFAIGAATYFEDKDFRNDLLRTAEIAGHTVAWNDSRHYLFADIALVGEAITLAMRTNTSMDNFHEK